MAGRPQRISQRLQSEPITVGDQIVQPVARLEGWLLPGDGNGGGAFVRLTPAIVTVRKHGQAYTVPLTDPTYHPLRTLYIISGAVALVALFVMLLTKLLTRRG